MSLSFDITESMLFREFSDEESRAIHCISILHNNVTIAFKSNKNKQYIFKSADFYSPVIRRFVRNYNKNKDSIGTFISDARKSGFLEIIKDF
jgi:hypothetical protein